MDLRQSQVDLRQVGIKVLHLRDFKVLRQLGMCNQMGILLRPALGHLVHVVHVVLSHHLHLLLSLLLTRHVPRAKSWG
jgi:hypothetical protein